MLSRVFLRGIQWDNNQLGPWVLLIIENPAAIVSGYNFRVVVREHPVVHQNIVRTLQEVC